MRFRALFGVAAALFAINVGFGVLVPLLPHLTQSLGEGTVLLASIFSLFSGARIAAQVPGGVIFDRMGDSRLLLISLLFYVLSIGGMMLCRDARWFVGLRLLEGVAMGFSFPAASSVVIRVSSRESTGRSLGWVAGGSGLGFVAGPLLGAALLPFGLRAPFWAAVALGGVTLLLCLVLLPRRPEPGEPLRLGKEVRQMWALVSAPAFLVLLSPVLLNKLVISGLQPLLPLYGPAVLGIPLRTVTLLFAAMAVTYAVTQPPAGWLADRLPPRPLIGALMTAQLLFLAGLGFPRSFAPFLAIFIGTAACMSISFTACFRQVDARFGTTGGTGRLFGLVGTTTDVAMVVGPPIALGLFQQIGPSVFPALAAAGLVALAAYLRH